MASGGCDRNAVPVKPTKLDGVAETNAPAISDIVDVEKAPYSTLCVRNPPALRVGKQSTLCVGNPPVDPCSWPILLAT